MSRCSRIRAVAVIGVVLALAGCAGASERSDEQRTERTATVGTDCFTISQARDFRYLDDRNLIVYAPARQAYHLELGYACVRLRGEISVGLRSRTDRMCGFAGDAIIVDGAFRERCPVLSVQRLDEDALQALLDQFEAGREGAPAVEVEIPASEE